MRRLPYLTVVLLLNLALTSAPMSAESPGHSEDRSRIVATGSGAPSRAPDPSARLPQPVAHPDPAKTTQTGRFTFMTFNIHGAFWPFGYSSYKQHKSGEFCRHLHPNLLVLQENFYDYIDQELDANNCSPQFEPSAPCPYNYVLHPTPPQVTGGLGNGLSTYSDWPIQQTDQEAWDVCHGSLFDLPWEYFSSDWDCIGAKGLSQVVVDYDPQTPTNPYLNIYNIHTDAGRGRKDRRARSRQLDQLADHVHNYAWRWPVMIAGDWNLLWDDGDDHNLLNHFLETNSFTLMTHGPIPGTNHLVLQIPYKFDYVAFRGNDGFRLSRIDGYRMLPTGTSDHSPIWGEFAYSVDPIGFVEMIDPAPGSEIAGKGATFTWAPGDNLRQIQIRIRRLTDDDNELVRDQLYFARLPGDATQFKAPHLPRSPRGNSIKVWLSSIGLNGVSILKSYTYTLKPYTGEPLPAEMESPPVGEPLPSTTVTFRWTTGRQVEAYRLTIVRSSNQELLFDQTVPVNTTHLTVPGLPDSGEWLEATLASKIGGTWDADHELVYAYQSHLRDPEEPPPPNPVPEPPFGYVDTPQDGAQVAGSVALTGWALDDEGVVHVKVFLEPDHAYVGTALFVAGARPDVALAYPGYPNSARAGWGYMLLTNTLPNGGNGAYTLSFVATDSSGHQTVLGTRSIVVDNAGSSLPFGTIDTPAPGQTASGTAYRVQGWVLTPQPNVIPTDGSTIQVFVDGQTVGTAHYNIYRKDVATLFPGYRNSSGALAYLDLDTTPFVNGQHTIAWQVTDSAGNAAGIGSRYFQIDNGGGAKLMEEVEPRLWLTTPNGGEYLMLGQEYQIQWQSVGVSGPLKIALWSDGAPVGLIARDLAAADGAYSWEVGELLNGAEVPEGGNYEIKIKEIPTTVTDFSDDRFDIFQPALRILAPTQSQDLVRGAPCRIAWRPVFVPHPVGISLFKDGVEIGQIAAPVVNPLTEQYEWTAGQLSDGSVAPAGSGYTVVVWEDGGLATIAESATPFNLEDTPYLALRAPQSGDLLTWGSSHAIRWEALNFEDTTTLVLVRDDEEVGVIASGVDSDSGEYLWNVGVLDDASSVPAGPGYSIRLVLENSTGRYDDSPLAATLDGTFGITDSPGISILAPDGGESWAEGSIRSITWYAAGVDSDLQLALSRDGQYLGLIAGDLDPTVSEYAWLVGRLDDGTVVPSGTGYRVEIAEQGGGSYTVLSEGPFTILEPYPNQVTLLAPNGGESWTLGDSEMIYWTTAGDFPYHDLEISLWQGGQQVGSIAGGLDPAAGSFRWSVGQLGSGQRAGAGTGYRIEVAATDSGAHSLHDLSDGVLELAPVYEPPAITVSSPNAGDRWTLGSIHHIAWNATGTFSDDLVISLWRNGSLVGIVAEDVDPAVGAFEWTAGRLHDGSPADAGGGYVVRVAAQEAEDHVYGTSAGAFTLCARAWEAVTTPRMSWQTSCFGGSLFVAAGTGGILATSPDGASWSDALWNPAMGGYSIMGVAYRGVFVAVGTNGLVLTSPDGTTWSQRSAGTVRNLQGVGAGDGRFVAVGDRGRIQTSDDDGMTWTQRSSPVTSALYRVCHGDGLYVAVGASGVILTSSNGTSWTRRSSGVGAAAIRNVAFGGSRYVAVADGGRILISSNGTSWTKVTSGVTANLYAVGYSVDDDMFVVGGNSGVLLTSADGATWSRMDSPTNQQIRDLSYGNATFSAAGNYVLLRSVCGE